MTLRLLPALLLVGVVAGCGSSPTDELPLGAGGTSTETGKIVINDILVDGPHGLTAGTDAPLRLSMTNESRTTDDALVGVSTPIADHATFEHDGHTVPDIVIPAETQVDLEWRTWVELHGVRRKLTRGQWFPVTLMFRRAAPVTVQVTVGPLGRLRDARAWHTPRAA